MKVAIIDDEATSIEALVNRLGRYDVDIVGTAQSGAKGLTLVKQTAPDLLFLDVELPDMSGLEFLDRIERIARRPCRVVVYTAHDKYMLPAFRNKAFDFLLKPVDDAELRSVIERSLIEQETTAPAAGADSRTDREKLILYTNATDFRIVNTNDVGVFQYNHELRVWEVVVASHESPVRLKRSANNDTLVAIDPRFIQVSQKFIVNIDYLMEVNDSTCRFYPPFERIGYVKVGRQFRKRLLERFNAL